MFKKKIITEGRKKYLIDNERDAKILKQSKLLVKKKLSKGDLQLVKLIKTQLEKNWRKYLLQELNKLLKKYK